MWCELAVVFFAVLCGVYRWRALKAERTAEFYTYLGQTTFSIIQANVTREVWNKWVRDYKEKEDGAGIRGGT